MDGTFVAIPPMELYSAAYHGNAPAIKKLLARGANKHFRHPHGGATALYVACEFGHHEVAKLLIEANARPDEARDDGATPLVKACQDGGKLEIARLLLEAGAEVNKQDTHGMTPLWVACHQATGARVTPTTIRSPQPRPLSRVQGRTELVKVLLKAGADPLKRMQGWSPLDLAWRNGRDEIAKELLAALSPEEREKARIPREP